LGRPTVGVPQPGSPLEPQTTELKTRRLFAQPWKYGEGFVLAGLLTTIGFSLEAFWGPSGLSQIAFPHNIYVGIFFLFFVGSASLMFRKHPLVRWFGTVHAALTSIANFTFLVFVMAMFPQENTAFGDMGTVAPFFKAIGATRMTENWAFLFGLLYFMLCLAFVAFKRTVPFKAKNIGFIITHFGLLITFFASALGSADLKRLIMEVEEGGQINWHAHDMQMVYELPIGVELIDFKVDEFLPKISIVDVHAMKLVLQEGSALPMAKTGLKAELLDWQLEVVEFHPEAKRDSLGNFVPTDEYGNAPAAYVRAYHAGRADAREGWISCGSIQEDPQALRLDFDHSLLLLTPEPEKFSSEVVLYGFDGSSTRETVEVNWPVELFGWKIYQLSYDADMGKWSRSSVLEFVRDPWQPVVYFGLFLVLAGAIEMFWLGQRIRPKEEQEADPADGKP